MDASFLTAMHLPTLFFVFVSSANEEGMKSFLVWRVQIVTLAHFVGGILILRNDSHGHLSTNLDVAQQRVRRGIVAVSEPRKYLGEVSSSGSIRTIPRLALLSMLIGIAIMPSGEYIRLGHGWPINDIEPPVLSPGAQYDLHFLDFVVSRKGRSLHSRAEYIWREDLSL